MKVLILAGGFGTRLSEETVIKPKPMVEIGGKPILWHIMKIYSHFGLNDFIILLGYKGYLIKEYFANYFIHQNSLNINLKNNSIEYLDNNSEPWNITLLDTGLDTLTGGRLKRAENYMNDDIFMLTYGDGVANININELLEFHKSHGKIATLTAVQPEARFGSLNINNSSRIEYFVEKPKGDGHWINGGFFVFNRQIFEYLKEGDNTVLEQSPLQTLAENGELMAFKHTGFWKPMDTQRDKTFLNNMWNSNTAKWKLWK
jgi:glucose-1-phosphate cytidylyltransferase